MKAGLSTRRIALCGLLLALMLALGYVESLLPGPAALPGVKLGLSNGVLIFAVYLLDIPTAFGLMALKVALSGLLFAGVGAMPYAAAGGALSLAAMAFLSRMRGLHPVAVSMAGGALHNVGQVAAAMLVLHTAGLTYYLAVLMVAGLCTGAVTGLAAVGVMKRLKGWHLKE